MKKNLFFICLILTVATGLKAQTAAKSVFFELGGPGLASINYDMRFQNKNDGLGFRVGFGGFSVEDASVLFIPVGLNYLIGKDGKNYFEVGGGLTVVSAGGDLVDDDGTFTTTFGHLNFGYRYQPTNGGFLFRAGIVPIFSSEGFVPYYAGVSFGYKF